MAIGITRMEEALVPREKGMSITGHRDSKSYGKYSREEVDLSSKVLQRVIFGQGTSFNNVYADEVLRRSETKVCDLLKAGDDVGVSHVQGTAGDSKPSKLPPCDNEPNPRLASNEKMKIVTIDEGKLGHTFKENNNCQIINLVFNNIDSKCTIAEILRNFAPVPFLSN